MNKNNQKTPINKSTGIEIIILSKYFFVSGWLKYHAQFIARDGPLEITGGRDEKFSVHT